jgi:hypothetical protein
LDASVIPNLMPLKRIGVQRRELASLQGIDLDQERGTLTMRQGRGREDRICPHPFHTSIAAPTIWKTSSFSSNSFGFIPIIE